MSGWALSLLCARLWVIARGSQLSSSRGDVSLFAFLLLTVSFLTSPPCILICDSSWGDVRFLASTGFLLPFFYLKIPVFLSFCLHSGALPWLCRSAILLRFQFGDLTFTYLTATNSVSVGF